MSEGNTLFCNNDARSLSQTEACFCHFPAHTQFARKTAYRGIEFNSEVPFVHFQHSIWSESPASLSCAPDVYI